MNSQVVTLLLVGVLLLGFEVFVPGVILGIAGGLFLLAGVLTAFWQQGVTSGLATLAVSLASIGAMLYFEFRILPRTRFGRGLFLDKAIDGTSQPPIATAADAVVGREAVALTALGPTGVVRVDGRRYEARCDSGFAVEGARLKVVRVETFQLVVIASD